MNKHSENLYLIEILKSKEREKMLKLYDKKTSLFRELINRNVDIKSLQKENEENFNENEDNLNENEVQYENKNQNNENQNNENQNNEKQSNENQNNENQNRKSK